MAANWVYLDCNSTFCNLNVDIQVFLEIFLSIVIVHFVI